MGLELANWLVNSFENITKISVARSDKSSLVFFFYGIMVL